LEHSSLRLQVRSLLFIAPDLDAWTLASSSLLGETSFLESKSKRKFSILFFVVGEQLQLALKLYPAHALTKVVTQDLDTDLNCQSLRKQTTTSTNTPPQRVLKIQSQIREPQLN
jgi:hypothetical protein